MSEQSTGKVKGCKTKWASSNVFNMSNSTSKYLVGDLKESYSIVLTAWTEVSTGLVILFYQSTLKKVRLLHLPSLCMLTFTNQEHKQFTYIQIPKLGSFQLVQHMRLDKGTWDILPGKKWLKHLYLLGLFSNTEDLLPEQIYFTFRTDRLICSGSEMEHNGISQKMTFAHN